jgi:hypothetical protein
LKHFPEKRLPVFREKMRQGDNGGAANIAAVITGQQMGSSRAIDIT